MVRGVAVAGAYAYVADWEGGLLILRWRNPHDFDGEGVVDLGDIILIAGAWGSRDRGSLAAYDFNGNHVVDIGDILVVAGQWGAE